MKKKGVRNRHAMFADISEIRNDYMLFYERVVDHLRFGFHADPINPAEIAELLLSALRNLAMRGSVRKRSCSKKNNKGKVQKLHASKFCNKMSDRCGAKMIFTSGRT